MTPDQRRAWLLNQFPVWPQFTVCGLFNHMANRFPDRPLILTKENSMTYRDVKVASRAIASGLVANGIQRGDRVAISMANHVEFPLLKLAIAQSGAVAVPINHLLRREEAKYILQQSGSRILIGMDRFRDHDYRADHVSYLEELPALDQIFVRNSYAQDASPMPSMDDLISRATASSEAELVAREAMASHTDISDVVYTSGTTGSPKGAVLTHDMLLRAAFSSALTRSFEDGRRIQFALPMYHVFGYVECWVAALFVGGAIIPHAVFDPAEMLDLAIALRATDMVCVPTMMHALIDEGRSRRFRSPHLVAVFNSGGSTPSSIWEDIRSVLGTREIHTGYGMTETTASTMCTFTEDPVSSLQDTNGRYKLAGPAGDPAIGGRVAEYRTVDTATGRELPLGEEGELQVRGPVVTPGYFDKPDETASAFTEDRWFRTGDLGRLLPGGHIKLTGRIKETYRCGGEMVMPQEIEILLSGFPGVDQLFAVGIPDPKMGEVGCLCIVPQRGENVCGDDIIAYCAKRLARFKVPKYVLLLQPGDIPLTATGRPQKFRLAEIAMKMLSLSRE